MARGNMIVTLVAQTKRFSNDLKNAGKSALTFGSVLKGGFGIALSAIGALGGALFTFLPNLISMAEESRKSERRLANVAKQMDLFGKNTDQVTQRLSEYAERIAFATGVDDELVRGAEAILLTFKQVAKSADDVGGNFDRATIAAVDLAAAGFGEVETNAKQLGKALNDPIKGLGALSRAGVTFTDKEKEKIRTLVESNKMLEAQDVILDAIEKQVGGTAEATASSTEKMRQRFEDMGEQLGTALLPAVDDLATQMGDWLDSVEGKKAIEDLTAQLEDFGDWITSPEGNQAVKDFATTMASLAEASIAVGQGLQAIYEAVKRFTGIPRWLLEMIFGEENFDRLRQGVDRINDPNSNTSGNPSAPGGPARFSKAPVVINFNTPVDSVSAGREIARVLSDYDRARGMR